MHTGTTPSGKNFRYDLNVRGAPGQGLRIGNDLVTSCPHCRRIVRVYGANNMSPRDRGEIMRSIGWEQVTASVWLCEQDKDDVYARAAIATGAAFPQSGRMPMGGFGAQPPGAGVGAGWVGVPMAAQAYPPQGFPQQQQQPMPPQAQQGYGPPPQGAYPPGPPPVMRAAPQPPRPVAHPHVPAQLPQPQPQPPQQQRMAPPPPQQQAALPQQFASPPQQQFAPPPPPRPQRAPRRPAIHDWRTHSGGAPAPELAPAYAPPPQAAPHAAPPVDPQLAAPPDYPPPYEQPDMQRAMAVASGTEGAPQPALGPAAQPAHLPAAEHEPQQGARPVLSPWGPFGQ